MWCIDGDGCFQMTAQELVTARSEGIPIKVAILNNAYLGMVRQWQEMFYDERYSEVYLSADLPDYVKWAEAMGCVGLRAPHARRRCTRSSTRPTRSTTCRSSSTFAPTPSEKVFPMVAVGREQRRHHGPPAAAMESRVSPPEPFLGDVPRTPVRHHILSVLVENKAGVLARIAGLFARRGFNIYSLAVAPAESHARFSRVTIVVDAESAPLEQIVGQLDKLVNVVAITDLAPADAVERELLLATLRSTTSIARRCSTSSPTRARRSSTSTPKSVTVMLAGTPAACDELERALEVFTEVELHRTGRVALPRLG